MNVLMLLAEEFPPDNRVEKEAQSLIENGFQVTIACRTLERGAKFEDYNGIKIYRLPLTNLDYKLSAACLVVPTYFRKWKLFVAGLFKKDHFDIIHVHDLPLSSVGYYFKKKYGLKLVCDQHEYYSNWIVHTAHYNTFLGKIVKALSPWKKYERNYLNKADLVVTVEEPLRQIYIRDVGVPPEKIVCVPNTPSAKLFSPENIDEKIVRKFQNDFVIFYAGGIDILRGIDVAIRALPTIIPEIPHVKILLCGKIIKPYDPIGLAKELGVEKNIQFDGWAPIEKLPSYVKASDLCFFTPPTNREEIHRTIATKIYQYMQYGKPVLVGQARMMKEFVEKYQIGFVIDEKSPKDFAEKVLNYYKNYKSESKRIQQNCELIKDQFVWEGTVRGVIEQYKSLLVEI
ncbi:MAG TPA: glycosyltransferase family 4 protein [Sunxiuqinia sp.]|nr:glycosyltransferase family 4 protein [Sunxiuqinia sp.]